ncbi:hypothetical protein T440DRAFT_189204 [Plenodomus tracheiphilus IPT5]|uniref:Uncharacterized protein n=1 Tax=Plenodomus tracheiphilus IPT5 TaxID=1408161 RepID=A0A6A7AWT4_9PLEO|nr:hypothetical protein T440DRAFT_189204 [Plenodomus tracheiphilus IPT5]
MRGCSGSHRIGPPCWIGPKSGPGRQMLISRSILSSVGFGVWYLCMVGTLTAHPHKSTCSHPFYSSV